MSNKKEPFYEPQRKTASATTENIDLGRVPSGWLYCYQRVAVEDETSGVDKIRVSTMLNEQVFEHTEQITATAAKLYWYDEPIYVKEGDYLRVTFTGMTTGDTLAVYASGWKQKIGRGE